MPESIHMETVLITGGTGLIGKALTKLLISRGYKVIILSRKSLPPAENVSFATWDLNKATIDLNAIRSADHIIHLAGAGVADKRWTTKRKQEIVDSRVNSGKLLVKALSETQHRVRTIVSASGIGWYGPDKTPKKPFIESDPHSNDFLGTTCQLWEDSIKGAGQSGIRTVILRTGIVLAKDGGAFPEFVKPMKAGVAAILGDGEQMVSWIHIDDICRLYLAAIELQHLQDVYNACAPEVVSNKTLVLNIARARKRPFIPVHVPEFALKLLLGEMSIEVLKSATVDDSKIRNAGFSFTFPTIDAAVNDLAH